MFLGAASALLLSGGVRFRGIGTIRGPWILAFCGFYVGVGIGLLKLRQWARMTTIVIAIVDVVLFGIALMNGLLRVRFEFLLVQLYPKVQLRIARLKIPVTAKRACMRPVWSYWCDRT